MAAGRRFGAEDSKTRAVLLDVTAKLMMEEGYAAVSSRRVAAEAGVKPALVHYYFRTMDDLFLAVFRRGADLNREREQKALAGSNPLRALWEVSADPAGTSLMMEFMALANHREALREAMAGFGEEFRSRQLEALSAALDEYGIDPDTFPPVAVLVLIASLSRVLVMEKALGITAGHPETLALIERYLRQYEG